MRTHDPASRSSAAWHCARRRCGARPGSLTPRVDGGGWFATTGVEPDLMEAARSAVRSMIDHLVRERGLSREDAYMLCSLAGDLKITEVVDAPNWMVGCFMPDAVFTDEEDG